MMTMIATNTNTNYKQYPLLCSAVVWMLRGLWAWYDVARTQLRGYAPVAIRAAPPPPASALAALARLGLIMAYFYLCDRTNFFMKENKYYSEWSFWLPVGYVFALGLFFTDESRSNT